MDASDYDTNTFLINNLSYVAFRIYEPVAAPSSAYTFAASDVEEALRNNGQLVYMDAVRRGIWCFFLVGKEMSSTQQPEYLGLDNIMEVCGYRLQLVDEGRFEPANLQSRPSGFNPIATPSSSSSAGSAFDTPARSLQVQNNAFPGSSTGPMDLDVKPAPIAISDAKGYGAVPIREIHEFFVTAVLSSLTTSFCHRLGAIPLNHRTVLLAPKASHGEQENLDFSEPLSILATFRVYLSTAGTFVISVAVSLANGLASSVENLRLQPLAGGSLVLAAPMGAFASFMSVLFEGDGHNLGQSPDTQISRYRAEPSDKFAQWRSTCARFLQMRGMSPALLDGCSWLNIHFVPRKAMDVRLDGRKMPTANSGPMAPWPAVLCFSKARAVSRRSGLGLDSKNLDPLGFTRDWLHSASDREQLLARKRKEKEAAKALEASEHDSVGAMHTMHSPLHLRGQAIQVASAPNGAMYPTPPDGLQPGITPSFDGTVSSPANQTTAMTSVDIDIPANSLASMTETFGERWDGNDVKREQPNGSFLESDNLFGDLGEDVFENHELTDADFNFFDEEPGQSMMDIDTTQDVALPTELSEAALNPPQPLPAVFETPQMEIPPPAPHFTKPELRHARSSLIESRQKANSENFQTNAGTAVKRGSSPFDMDTVYKRICASIHGLPAISSDGKQVHLPKRRGSVFEKVEFDPALSLASKKYQPKGQFNPTLPLANEAKDDNSSDKSSSYDPKWQNTPKIQPTAMRSLMAKINGHLEHNAHTLQHNMFRRDDPPSDADDVSLVSDQDDASDTSDEPCSPAISGMSKRRADDDAVSMAASFKDLEAGTMDAPAYGSIDLSRLSHPEHPELALHKYFADPEPVPYHQSRSDDELITVAQILTEQAVTGDLKLASPARWTEMQELRRSLMSAARQSMQGLRLALPRALGSVVACQLRPFLEVQDVPLLGPPTRLPPRPAGQEIVRPNYFTVPAPHVEVRRFETKLSILPSAITFWDSLGLGPAEGPKDVVAACVFPNMEGIKYSAGDFLDGLRSSYETLKLGAFDRLASAHGLENGLVPYLGEWDTTASLAGYAHGLGISEQLMKLGQALTSSAFTQKNFVMFFVYDPEQPESIVESCAAFHELFGRYKRALSERRKPVVNELVLQLIPLSSVSSETTVVILPPQDSFKLCIEVYDRCTLLNGPMPAPAIKIEEPLPRMIDFKLTSTPSANLLHEKSCIHIAYAQSVDERWITAAWTDTQGSQQMTASYCLGRRGKPNVTSFAEVAHEIWETTHDLISVWKVHWRVIITKCGPMDQSEAEFWTQLAQTESKATVSLTLMAVDTNPSLQLIPPLVKIPVTAAATFYSTPASTPQPLSILSPEQSGNPPTPMGATPSMSATTPGGESGITETDPDTTLVDASDTTWGMVASHRLNNSMSLTDLNPALVSGYLVKRGGSKAEDPPVVMEINVVYAEGNPRIFESVLREAMIHFRGLGTLARVRGVVDSVTDVRPWHVAAAEKGVRALYQLM